MGVCDACFQEEAMKRNAFELESPGRRRLVIAGGLGALAAGASPWLAAQQPGGLAVPSVGDTWRYQYRSEWRTVPPRTIDYRVDEVTPQGIRDRMSVVGLAGEDVKTFTSKVEEVDRTLEGFSAREFSPYLQAFTSLAQGATLAAPAMPPDAMFGLPWSIWVRVSGPERVTVPAGTFDAMRVDLKGSRPPFQLNTGAEPAYLYETVWFAPGPKRPVKHTRIVSSWALIQIERDTYELVSYKVA
jgi:hypothetical protein